MTHYDTTRMLFVAGNSYTYNLPLSHLTSISGIIMVLTLSLIFKKVTPVNWLGKHSLVIMLVHFPIQERLNQIVFLLFQTYDLTAMTKIMLVIIAYIITISFSIGAVIFCRRFIPKLSGYSYLVPVK